MKKVTLICSCLFVLFCLAGMGGSAVDSDGPTILGVSIRDKEVLTYAKPLSVSFSAPMVEEKDTDKVIPQKNWPLEIIPHVEGQGQWVNQTTFIFTPLKAYPPNKRYYVQFSDKLTDLKGQRVNYLYSFSTQPVSLNNLWLKAISDDRTSIHVGFYFTRAVDQEQLSSHLKVTDEETGATLPTKILSQTETASHVAEIAISPNTKKILLNLSSDSKNDLNPLGLVKTISQTLNVPSSQKIEEATVTTTPTNIASAIQINSINTSQNQTGQLGATFHLSQSISQDIDQSQYIRITPEFNYTMNYWGDTIRIKEGLTPGQQVTLTLLPGLMDRDGAILKEEISKTFTVGSYYPTIFFSEGGTYLTPADNSLIGVSMVNIDKVTVSVYRQYENNLHLTSIVNASENSDYYDDYYDYSSSNPFDDAMRLITSKEILFNSQEEKNPDTIIKKALDLAELCDNQKGLYRITITGYKKQPDNYYTYVANASKRVLLSDIGLTARTFPKGITVFATGISNGIPIGNAEAFVYSRSNQLIAKGMTDSQGVWVHKRDSAWDSQLQPHAVVLRTKQDVSVLPLNEYETGSTPETFGGAYLEDGYEAFVYTPRGVFRPGENVDIKAFIRNNKHMPPEPFPVIFSIVSPRNIEIAQNKCMLSPQGGANFRLALPTSAASGSYTAYIRLPGQTDKSLGNATFSVEDFTPPRLEIAVETEKDTYTGDTAIPVQVKADYLFGAPGAGLKTEIGYLASKTSFQPKGYQNFSFGNPEDKFIKEGNLKYIHATLDERGQITENFQPLTDWQRLNTPLFLRLIASVQEDGGRWGNQVHEVMYFPQEYLLGLEQTSPNLAVGTPMTFNVAAVKPDGSAAKPKELQIELLRVKEVWNTIIRNGQYVYKYSEYFNSELKDQARFDENGRAKISITPKKYGQYLLRVSSEEGKIVASKRLYLWGDEGSISEQGLGRLTTVELKLDKESYLPGETAKVSVKAPYAGTLFFSIERTEQMSTRTITMKEPSMILEVPVTADMEPNVTLTAWVYRPVDIADKEWYPHRASGVTQLVISQKPFTLNVTAETPERAKPDAPLTVPFTVTDSTGKPVQGEFSAAFIDEGVLSLTHFTTPDPIAFFYRRCAAVSKTSDIYNLLLRPELRGTKLLTAGGDAAADYQGSLSTQLIYLMEFVPTIMTDESGRGEAVFAIPEYSGKGRLMIVGAAGNIFASSSTSVRVGRDIAVEATAPHVVAPEDIFDVPVKTFITNPELEGKAKITISAEGPLEIVGSSIIDVPIVKGEKSSPQSNIKVKALPDQAIGTLSFAVSFPGREDLSFTKTLEIAVRSPFPRLSTTTTALIRPNKKETLALDGKWLPGSAKGTLSIGSSPALVLLPALQYLDAYPYGCLEQTTSRSWPILLALQNSSIFPAMGQQYSQEQLKEALQRHINRIASMQNGDGGFSSWPSYYNNSTPWKSINATLLLVEAKHHVPFNPKLLQNALAYVNYVLSAPDSQFESVATAYSTKAYAAFVLTRAGKAPLGWLQTLSAHTDKMYPSGQIYLAAAKALHAGNPTALHELTQKKLQTSVEDSPFNFTLESSLRNNGLLLLAWSLVAPDAVETHQLCKLLVDDLTKQKYYTTQNASMAALALGTYLQQNKLTDTIPQAKVTVGTSSYTTDDKGTLTLSGAQLPLTNTLAPTPVQVEVTNAAQAYAVYTMRGVPTETPKPKQENLKIERVWYNENGQPIVPDSKNGILLNKGDRVSVTITITSDRSIPDLVLSDLLPGGMEVENPRLISAANAAEDGTQEYGLYLDLREDRVLVFFDRIYSKQTYSYSMRAVNSGEFTLPPTAAEGMYNPEVNAIIETGKLTIK